MLRWTRDSCLGASAGLEPTCAKVDGLDARVLCIDVSALLLYSAFRVLLGELSEIVLGGVLRRIDRLARGRDSARGRGRDGVGVLLPLRQIAIDGGFDGVRWGRR